MKKFIKVLIIILGVISVLCSVLGLSYNLSTIWAGLSGAFGKIINEHSLIYFYHAFYVMSAICVVFHVLLLFCGIYFLKLQGRLTYLFEGVLLAEILCRSVGCHGKLQNPQFPFPTDGSSSHSPLGIKVNLRYIEEVKSLFQLSAWANASKWRCACISISRNPFIEEVQ